MTKYQIQVTGPNFSHWVASCSNPCTSLSFFGGFDTLLEAASVVGERLGNSNNFAYRIVEIDVDDGLPSASDLDSVSQEEKVREATEGKQ